VGPGITASPKEDIMAGLIYVATQSGFITVNGEEVPLISGVTRVREGHAILKARPDMFRELTVHYDVETARQAPKAEAKPETAKAKPKVVEEDPEPLDDGPAGLTSDDAPQAPQPRGRRRVQKTGD
jgi:ABC-type lipopolysaccharide export system ATPase subunit